MGQGAPAGAKVTFSFFAPRNLAVNVLGDFTKWRPEPMQRDARGWWWCARHLPDGGYGYRFQVLSVTPGSEGQWVNVTDLRAPCLPGDGSANCICIVDGRVCSSGYVWRHDDAPLALDGSLAEARLMPDSACFGGAAPSCCAVIEALDEMAACGVRALIVPCVSTTPAIGYDVRHPFFPAAEYVERDSFKRMVDECHSRGLRVVVEMEALQGDPAGTLAQIDYGYWYRMPPRAVPNVHAAPPRFDYHRKDEQRGIFPAREFRRACLFHWIDTYHIDGVRFVGITSEAERGFLAQLGDEARARVTVKPFHTQVG
ncbi:MAG: hypothetical protein U0641_02810 [Anaerolineae bacterium]